LRGIKGFPTSKFFVKLVNKNEIKHQKVVPYPPDFLQPLYIIPPKIWQKPHVLNVPPSSLFMPHSVYISRFK